MNTQTLMIQGTTSDAGKSFLVTALCRWLARQDIRVVPFKPQNMALNSVVSVDGGEIGRAQAVQAFACGLEPHTDMNPVLLKPNSDTGAQVIIHGQAVGNMNAVSYHDYKSVALNAVLESHARLITNYEKIIVEGAGSPAEINLRDNDIANMGFAESIDCPVILIADIDRGGVFAHLVGTLSLLSDSEQERIKGFVINRFRGDLALLGPGLKWLSEHTGKPVLGVLPYLQGLHLEAEDALPRAQLSTGTETVKTIQIIIPALPRISNHTDFDPLRLHPQVSLKFIGPGAVIPPADLIILPGSKSVRADLDWIYKQGWKKEIHRHLRYGGKLIGICGGFQMMGKKIHDPDALEGDAGSSTGLSFFDMTTTLKQNKILQNVTGSLAFNGAAVSGYEIHAGITDFGSYYKPAIKFIHGTDGAISEDGLILGTYWHGLFESSTACSALLAWIASDEVIQPSDYQVLRETSVNRLADCVSEHIDTIQLGKLLGLDTASA